jgi:hypothetical protein
VLSPFSIAFFVCSSCAFIAKELKILYPLNNTILSQFLHRFDSKFGDWAPLASLIIMPSPLIARLSNIFIVSYTLYQPLSDFIIYWRNRLFTLNMMRFASAFGRFQYLPNFVRNTYNATLGRVHDELEAFFDYYQRPALTPQRIKEFARAHDSNQLRISFEALYLGGPLALAEGRYNRAQPGIEESLRKFDSALTLCTHNPDSLAVFLQQLEQHIPSYRHDVMAVINNEQMLLAVIQLLRIRNEAEYHAQSQQQPAPVQAIARRLRENSQSIEAVIVNPEIQPGANVIPGTTKKARRGVSEICDKICREIDDNNAQNAARLLARLFDKSLRCQNGLMGLIEEEVPLPVISPQPLQASWRDYLNQKIAAVQQRFIRAFAAEVAQNPAIPGGVDPVKRQVVEQLMSFDPANVDNQRIIAAKFIPQTTLNEGFATFSRVVLDRNTDFAELIPGYIGSSVYQHLLYPTLFTAETVEQMIARTQEVYARAKMQQEDAGLPQWAQRWEHAWNNYLQEAYPRQQPEILPEPADSQNLLAEYIRHQNADSRAPALYDTQIDEEQRANLEDRAFIGLMSDDKMQRLIDAIGADNLPEGFDDWSDYQKREYLHMNKSYCKGLDIDSSLVDGDIGLEQQLLAQRVFVPREFALVVLFSENIITPEHQLHESFGRLGMLSSFLYSDRQLKTLGYTN